MLPPCFEQTCACYFEKAPNPFAAKKLFDEIPWVTYRRCRNLNDSLVISTLPRKVPDSAGSKCCGKTKCKVADLLDTTTFSNTLEKTKNKF